MVLNFTDDVLQPTVPAQNQRGALIGQQSGKILANDLDSSLANLVGNLGFGGTPSKNFMYLNLTASFLFVSSKVPAPVAYPVNTPQVPVYGMVPSQIGAPPIMAPQPMIYTQPGLRPTNPFAPISGTQIQFM
ncbi:hypothetical protein lerEdw1_002492 [Lerista edwardsae]|nr:hypothetical protein lerEdw1_002492 [Lerista edwardsae]